ncbi:hypothetical protein FS837_002920 [Tulasnella sp. UAMH 9824]|nr:hypothetical protein FS837_002920 [Tulasnella sp. UAMH 9824]
MGGTQPQQADHPITRLSPSTLSDVWALMRRCWNKEKNERPTMQNILDDLEAIATLNV